MTAAQETFFHCRHIVTELVEAGRKEEALAILRALQAYLDMAPATPDGSCRSIVLREAEVLSDQVRKEKKK